MNEAKQLKPIFTVVIFVFILTLFAVVITYITGCNDKGECSITFRCETDTQKLSREEKEDLANKLIMLIKTHVPGNEDNFMWQYDEAGVQIIVTCGRQSARKLKHMKKAIELEMSVYLRITELADRQKSLKNLKQLGQTLVEYAQNNNNNFPDSLEELKPYSVNKLLSWLLENVEYLGKGKNWDRVSYSAPIAYDKVLLKKGNGTTVLFGDKYHGFVKVERLTELGIVPRGQQP